jgi:hypothetical protein
MLFKDDVEHPIPTHLRETFRQIAHSFVAGDFQLRDHPVERVLPVSAQTAAWIAENVAAYGDTLAPLDDRTWDRSFYRWMEGYWEVLVDLTTLGEPASDLTLHAKLYERGNDFALHVYGVYVP